MKNIKTEICLEQRRGRMKKELALYFLILLSFVLINTSFTSAVNDFDQYKPYLHNPSVGDVPKLETFGEYKTELYPGAGTYTYNIIVPPGVLGLQPSVSLFYNSQNVLQRPGIIGAGWSLSENSVSRSINYTVNGESDDYFIISFNNNRLKVFYNGSSWNTEINPHQYRIQNLTNGGERYWLVTTTDGTNTNFIVSSTTGNVGIGTGNPSFPLTVINSVSDGTNLVSIWVSSNISATGYITRTSVYDTSKGEALNYTQDAKYYMDQRGKIDHKKFYGYASYDVTETDYTRPEVKDEEVCDTIFNKETQIEEQTNCRTEQITIYPYTLTHKEEGVELGKEIDVLRQAVYELKQELCSKDNSYEFC
ncbi:MAG: hypothetical protein AABX29_08480 [Nanoarchaeota archaeon]